jgi:glutamine synthetase
MNLLDPGQTPNENIQFLLVLACMIKAIDVHACLLRQSASDVGNDHRLGAAEAPPAIISVFLGDQLDDVVEQLVSTGEARKSKRGGKLRTGVSTLPDLEKDATDRNRTSPFAFTGNKFEFRMPGSAVSVANANIVLNTAVAQALSDIYEELKAVAVDELPDAIQKLLQKRLAAHKRVLFNGNGYTDEWVEEAGRRGLDNLKSLPDAMPRWISDKSVKLFTTHKVLTKEEIFSRYEILLENYSKTLHIESLTLQEMVRKDFISGLLAYMKDLTEEAAGKKALLSADACAMEEEILKKLSADAKEITEKLNKLTEDTKQAEQTADVLEDAKYYESVVLKDMEALRSVVDDAEAMIPDQYLPYPTYGAMLFSLR